jgi:alpha-methylacyl-CoA racemase
MAGPLAGLRVVEPQGRGPGPFGAERLGGGPEACLRRNPRLVYARITGWGQSGPYSQVPGHDINDGALSGVLDTLRRDGQPPAPPLNLLGDYGGGGMLLAVGILAALVERSASGRGQVARPSATGAACWRAPAPASRQY